MEVLIVAKCNVNTYNHSGIQQENDVLIVAKCNVNYNRFNRTEYI